MASGIVSVCILFGADCCNILEQKNRRGKAVEEIFVKDSVDDSGVSRMEECY